MALTQPTLYSQVAFDATEQHIFSFNVIGGDQVVANTLTIKNNTTNETVYSQREETFALAHTLPANSLTNGIYYVATLTTENASGETSVASNAIQFYCYATPVLVFTNLVSGTNLTTSSYNFEISYNQTENEPLEQYSFNLYDFSSNLISTSGVLYTGTTSVPFLAQYTFMGLINSNSYYIECTGVTSQGTQISTGLILFGINYNSSSTKLNLVNNCLEGYIYISSNPIPIFGYSNPENPTYVTYDDDMYIDMSEDGYYVLWDNGFTTSTTDWTLSIWGRNLNDNKTICILKNNNQDNIKIDYIVENGNAYLMLTATNYNTGYYYRIISDSITTPIDNDDIMIWVRRIDNIYDIVLTNLEA